MSEAKQQFADYFAKNYPADTVIVDPHWHAPRIFRAAVAALSAEQTGPVAWGIALNDEMVSVYLNRDECKLEFDRRNRQYPEPTRKMIELASPIAAPASQPTDTEILDFAARFDGTNSRQIVLRQSQIIEFTRALLAASQPDAAAIRNKALEEITDDHIREIFLANGFKLNGEVANGKPDLRPYVYQAGRALVDAAIRALATQSPAQQEPEWKCVCGENPTPIDADLVGCGKPINSPEEVYRCTDCAVPFHRECAKRHFETDTPEHATKVFDEQLRRLDGQSYAAPTAQQAGQPAPAVPELRNIMGAHMLGDFVVQVEFPSCRSASAFKQAIDAALSAQKEGE